jgi:5,10-methylenetetrahydromethanopterin reductase
MTDTAQAIGMMLHGGTAPNRLSELSKKVESLGFGSLWLSEDYFFLGGVASAAIALEATESIQVGVGILSAVVRHPAVTAMEVATLVNAYPGRLLTGIGHGLPVWTQQMGLYPKSPLKALRQVVESVRALLGGETLNSKGELFEFNDVTLIHPVAGDVPILTGVIGPKSLELSGEIADGTIMSVIAGPKYLEYVKRHVAVGAAKSGRDADKHMLPTFVIYNVDEDGDAARAGARAGVAFYLWAIGPSPMTEVYGINEQLTAMIAEGGLEAVSAQMPADWLDLFAVSGTPADCAEQIPAFLDAGATSLVLAPYPTDNLEKMIELTASGVLPLL